MAHEILVGLEVLDDEKYRQYRAAMMPILAQYQGAFGYDFTVSKVLKSPTQEPINRVFTLCFPNANNMDSFFSDAEYLTVKALYFTDSVASTTMISSYEK